MGQVGLALLRHDQPVLLRYRNKRRVRKPCLHRLPSILGNPAVPEKGAAPARTDHTDPTSGQALFFYDLRPKLGDCSGTDIGDPTLVPALACDHVLRCNLRRESDHYWLTLAGKNQMLVAPIKGQVLPRIIAIATVGPEDQKRIEIVFFHELARTAPTVVALLIDGCGAGKSRHPRSPLCGSPLTYHCAI